MAVDPRQYRVVTRGKAVAMVAAIALAAGVMLWHALGWVDVVAERQTPFHPFQLKFEALSPGARLDFS